MSKKKTTVTRLYTGDDGQSHFEEIVVDMLPNIVGHISETFGAMSNSEFDIS